MAEANGPTIEGATGAINADQQESVGQPMVDNHRQYRVKKGTEEIVERLRQQMGTRNREYVNAKTGVDDDKRRTVSGELPLFTGKEKGEKDRNARLNWRAADMATSYLARNVAVTPEEIVGIVTREDSPKTRQLLQAVCRRLPKDNLNYDTIISALAADMTPISSSKRLAYKDAIAAVRGKMYEDVEWAISMREKGGEGLARPTDTRSQMLNAIGDIEDRLAGISTKEGVTQGPEFKQELIENYLSAYSRENGKDFLDALFLDLFDRAHMGIGWLKRSVVKPQNDKQTLKALKRHRNAMRPKLTQGTSIVRSDEQPEVPADFGKYPIVRKPGEAIVPHIKDQSPEVDETIPSPSTPTPSTRQESERGRRSPSLRLVPRLDRTVPLDSYLNSRPYKSAEKWLNSHLSNPENLPEELRPQEGQPVDLARAKELVYEVLKDTAAFPKDHWVKKLLALGSPDAADLARAIYADRMEAERKATQTLLEARRTILTGTADYVKKDVERYGGDSSIEEAEGEQKYFRNGEIVDEARLDMQSVRLLKTELEQVVNNNIANIDGLSHLPQAKQIVTDIVAGAEGKDITYAFVLEALEKKMDASNAPDRLEVKQAYTAVRWNFFHNMEVALENRRNIRLGVGGQALNMEGLPKQVIVDMANKLNDLGDYSDPDNEMNITPASLDRLTEQHIKTIRSERAKNKLQTSIEENREHLQTHFFQLALKGTDRWRRTAVEPQSVRKNYEVPEFGFEEGDVTGGQPGGPTQTADSDIPGRKPTPAPENPEGQGEGSPTGETPPVAPVDEVGETEPGSAPIDEQTERELPTEVVLAMVSHVDRAQQNILHLTKHSIARDTTLPPSKRDFAINWMRKGGKIGNFAYGIGYSLLHPVRAIWQNTVAKGLFDMQHLRFAADIENEAKRISGTDASIPVELTEEIIDRVDQEAQSVWKNMNFGQKVGAFMRDKLVGFSGYFLNSHQRRARDWFVANGASIIDSYKNRSIQEQTEMGERFALVSPGLTVQQANPYVISTTMDESRHELADLLHDAPNLNASVINDHIRGLVEQYATGALASDEALLGELNKYYKKDIIPNLPGTLSSELSASEFSSNILPIAQTVRSNITAYQAREGDGKSKLEKMNFRILIGRGEWGQARGKAELGYFTDKLATRLAERGYSVSDRRADSAKAAAENIIKDLGFYAGGLLGGLAVTTRSSAFSTLGMFLGPVGAVGGLAAAGYFKEAGIVRSDKGTLRGIGGRKLSEFTSAQWELARNRQVPGGGLAPVFAELAAYAVQSSRVESLISKIETASNDQDLAIALAEAKARLRLTDQSVKPEGPLALAVPQNFIGYTEGNENEEGRQLRNQVLRGVFKLSATNPTMYAQMDSAEKVVEAQLRRGSDPKHITEWLTTTGGMSQANAQSAMNQFFVRRGNLNIAERQALENSMYRLAWMNIRRGAGVAVRVALTAPIMGIGGKAIFGEGAELIHDIQDRSWNPAVGVGDYFGDWGKALIHSPAIVERGGHLVSDLGPIQRGVAWARDVAAPGASHDITLNALKIHVPGSIQYDSTSGHEAIVDMRNGHVYDIRGLNAVVNTPSSGKLELAFADSNGVTKFTLPPSFDLKLDGGGGGAPLTPDHTATVTAIDGTAVSVHLPPGTEWRGTDLVRTSDNHILIHNALLDHNGSYLGATSTDSGIIINNGAAIGGGTHTSTVTILNPDGTIDAHGPWATHSTDAHNMEWYAYNKAGSQLNELRLHTLKETNSAGEPVAILSMDTMKAHLSTQIGNHPETVDVGHMMQHPEIYNNTNDGMVGFDIEWQGHHLFVPSSGNLRLDPSDHTTDIALPTGGHTTPAELYPLIVNHDYLKGLSNGNIATELHHNPQVWSGDYIHAAIYKVIDGKPTVQSLATIHAANHPTEITTEITDPSHFEPQVTLPGSEPGYSLTPPGPHLDLYFAPLPSRLRKERSVSGQSSQQPSGTSQLGQNQSGTTSSTGATTPTPAPDAEQAAADSGLELPQGNLEELQEQLAAQIDRFFNEATPEQILAALKLLDNERFKQWDESMINELKRKPDKFVVGRIAAGIIGDELMKLKMEEYEALDEAEKEQIRVAAAAEIEQKTALTEEAKEWRDNGEMKKYEAASQKVLAGLAGLQLSTDEYAQKVADDMEKELGIDRGALEILVMRYRTIKSIPFITNQILVDELIRSRPEAAAIIDTKFGQRLEELMGVFSTSQDEEETTTAESAIPVIKFEAGAKDTLPLDGEKGTLMMVGTYLKDQLVVPNQFNNWMAANNVGGSSINLKEALDISKAAIQPAGENQISINGVVVATDHLRAALRGQLEAGFNRWATIESVMPGQIITRRVINIPLKDVNGRLIVLRVDGETYGFLKNITLNDAERARKRDARISAAGEVFKEGTTEYAKLNVELKGQHYEATVASDVGGHRVMDEDYSMAETGMIAGLDWNIFLVADGMGGEAAGDKASVMVGEVAKWVLRELEAHPETISLDVNGLKSSNLQVRMGEVQKIFDYMRGRIKDESLQRGISQQGGGSTLVGMIEIGGYFYGFNCGDSRLYRKRGNNLTQLTKDHSLIQSLIDIGQVKPEDAKIHPQRSTVYRDAANGEKIDIIPIEDFAEGDVFLALCDGLPEAYDNEYTNNPSDMLAALNESLQTDNPALHFVKGAFNGRGALSPGVTADNISAIVIRPRAAVA